MGRVQVGRQPIFDRSLEVLGYELLFRSADEATAAVESGDMATTRVILNTFTEFGLDRLVGGKLAFVNVTRPFVVGSMPVPFSPEVAVLELLPSVQADPMTLAGAEQLRAGGYAIALDDFAFEPERLDFLALARYVKLDMLKAEPAELADRAARARDHGVELIAYRMETLKHMEAATALGFDYYQGHYLVRPDVVSASSISPSQVTALQLLTALSDPEVPLGEIEAVIQLDLALNYRVLRAANAAASGAHRRVDSIRDALVVLGVQRLRAWLLLMVLADAGTTNTEQLSNAMTRARTCELLAESQSGPQATTKPATAFVAGLLSSLEVVLGVSVENLLGQMPLTEELAAALGHRSGPLGRLLAAVIAYEEQDIAALEATGLTLFDVSRAYLAAVGWSLQAVESAMSTN
jgi:c-di-GMP-related signal transduction protein